MKTFKAKSLTPEKTDNQILNDCHTTRFISFEAAIQMFNEMHNLNKPEDKPIGYKVTEQGIEIILK